MRDPLLLLHRLDDQTRRSLPTGWTKGWTRAGPILRAVRRGQARRCTCEPAPDWTFQRLFSSGSIPQGLQTFSLNIK